MGERKQMMMRPMAIAILILGGTVYSAEAASTDPTLTCRLKKNAAASKTTKALFQCEAKAAKNGVAVESDCEDAARAKLPLAFAKAETPGACRTPGDADSTLVLIDALIADVVSALRPNPSIPSTGTAKKFTAAGKFAKSTIGAKWLKLDKFEAALLKAFQAAEGIQAPAAPLQPATAAVDVQTTGDAQTIQSKIEAAAGQIRNLKQCQYTGCPNSPCSDVYSVPSSGSVNNCNVYGPNAPREPDGSGGFHYCSGSTTTDGPPGTACCVTGQTCAAQGDLCHFGQCQNSGCVIDFTRTCPNGEACDPYKGCPDHPSPPDPPSPSASGQGDPHLVTFDGLAYDFQGAGEFVLAESLDDDFGIQARMQPYSGSRLVAVNTAVAARVVGDRVAVYAGRTPAVFVNGFPLGIDELATMPGGGLIDYRPGLGLTTLVWPDGSELQLHIIGTHIDVLVGLASSRGGRVRGLFGDFDGSTMGDLMTRDASVLTTPVSRQALYGAYAESWRIQQASTLFDYFNGETTDFYTDRAFPDALSGADTLPQAVRDQAQAACANAGITDAVLLSNCILDVGLTSDPTFANLPAGITPPQDSVQATETSCLAIDGTWSWSNGGVVAITANGTLSESSPADAGTWTCSGGVYVLVWNSGSTDTLTVSSDGLTLSGQSSLGGNVGAIRSSVGQPSLSEDFTAFDASKWIVGGNAHWNPGSGDFTLTDAIGGEAGRLYYATPLVVGAFHAEFDYDMSGGSGADGLTFSVVRDPNYASSVGGGLDWFGASGYAVEFDSFVNGADPPGEHVAVLGDSGELTFALTSVRGTHHVAVDLNSLGEIRVALDGTSLIDYTIPGFTPFAGFYGFTAATGGLTDNHVIDNFALSPAS